MIKKVFLIAVLTLSSTLLCKEVLLDKIIAVVNDSITTESDLKDFDRVMKTRKTKMEPSVYASITLSLIHI